MPSPSSCGPSSAPTMSMPNSTTGWSRSSSLPYPARALSEILREPRRFSCGVRISRKNTRLSTCGFAGPPRNSGPSSSSSTPGPPDWTTEPPTWCDIGLVRVQKFYPICEAGRARMRRSRRLLATAPSWLWSGGPGWARIPASQRPWLPGCGPSPTPQCYRWLAEETFTARWIWDWRPISCRAGYL